MHEISVLQKAVDLAEEVANENNVGQIAYITLDVGELSGYLPVFFEKYYPIVIENRPIFKDSQLIIHTVPGEALCKDCSAMYNVLSNKGVCPKCGSRHKKILGGTQFALKEIGYK